MAGIPPTIDRRGLLVGAAYAVTHLRAARAGVDPAVVAYGPAGVEAKLARLATRCAWEPEEAIRACGLVPSIVADVSGLL